MQNKLKRFLLVVSTAVVCQSCYLYPRCPIPGCHVRMVHQHNKQSFRGEPWWRLNQNRKQGQDFKPTPEPLPKYSDK